jgi:hypothetical protein
MSEREIEVMQKYLLRSLFEVDTLRAEIEQLKGGGLLSGLHAIVRDDNEKLREQLRIAVEALEARNAYVNDAALKKIKELNK